MTQNSIKINEIEIEEKPSGSKINENETNLVEFNEEKSNEQTVKMTTNEIEKQKGPMNDSSSIIAKIEKKIDSKFN